ncbi:hypothetical protein WMY93_026776 [Mugilogobius chulae]|uniref:Uncharacterized protein n=1 Tax=Mugilogobius chulae TaxID=88201 RepID=A0AAW0N448_9GOBI
MEFKYLTRPKVLKAEQTSTVTDSATLDVPRVDSNLATVAPANISKPLQGDGAITELTKVESKMIYSVIKDDKSPEVIVKDTEQQCRAIKETSAKPVVESSSKSKKKKKKTREQGADGTTPEQTNDANITSVSEKVPVEVTAQETHQVDENEKSTESSSKSKKKKKKTMSETAKENKTPKIDIQQTDIPALPSPTDKYEGGCDVDTSKEKETVSGNSDMPQVDSKETACVPENASLQTSSPKEKTVSDITLQPQDSTCKDEIIKDSQMVELKSSDEQLEPKESVTHESVLEKTLTEEVNTSIKETKSKRKKKTTASDSYKDTSPEIKPAVRDETKITEESMPTPAAELSVDMMTDTTRSACPSSTVPQDEPKDTTTTETSSVSKIIQQSTAPDQKITEAEIKQTREIKNLPNTEEAFVEKVIPSVIKEMQPDALEERVHKSSLDVTSESHQEPPASSKSKRKKKKSESEMLKDSPGKIEMLSANVTGTNNEQIGQSETIKSIDINVKPVAGISKDNKASSESSDLPQEDNVLENKTSLDPSRSKKKTFTEITLQPQDSTCKDEIIQDSQIVELKSSDEQLKPNEPMVQKSTVEMTVTEDANASVGETKSKRKKKKSVNESPKDTSPEIKSTLTAEETTDNTQSACPSSKPCNEPTSETSSVSKTNQEPTKPEKMGGEKKVKGQKLTQVQMIKNLPNTEAQIANVITPVIHEESVEVTVHESTSTATSESHQEAPKQSRPTENTITTTTPKTVTVQKITQVEFVQESLDLQLDRQKPVIDEATVETSLTQQSEEVIISAKETKSKKKKKKSVSELSRDSSLEIKAAAIEETHTEAKTITSTPAPISHPEPKTEMITKGESVCPSSTVPPVEFVQDAESISVCKTNKEPASPKDTVGNVVEEKIVSVKEITNSEPIQKDSNCEWQPDNTQSQSSKVISSESVKMTDKGQSSNGRTTQVEAKTQIADTSSKSKAKKKSPGHSSSQVKKETMKTIHVEKVTIEPTKAEDCQEFLSHRQNQHKL